MQPKTCEDQLLIALSVKQFEAISLLPAMGTDQAEVKPVLRGVGVTQVPG